MIMRLKVILLNEFKRQIFTILNHSFYEFLFIIISQFISIYYKKKMKQRTNSLEKREIAWRTSDFIVNSKKLS